MNENEIQRLAAMANALRPDWPTASLVALLNRPQIARRGRRDVAVALAWVACESDTKTPARMLEAGPWWNAAAVEGASTGTRHPTRDEACPLHAAHYRDNCAGCEADRKAGDQLQRPDHPAQPDEVAEHLARARAAIKPRETEESPNA